MTSFANAPASVRPRILVVEDDRDLREGLAEYLRLHDMVVIEAASAEGFHAARCVGNFHVTILDVNLPDGNGFDLAAGMLGDTPRSGIIILTARTGQEDRIRGYNEGTDIYMTKPFASEELLLAVRNLLRRVSPRTSKPDAVPQTWRLDVIAHSLIAPDGRVVVLSGREILLIEQFIGRNIEPISRQMLSERLGYGVPSQENRALDAALRRLRQKFTEAGLESPLLSANKFGLRFAPPLQVL